MNYLQYFRLFEAYSNHKYHTEILDDLLDSIQSVLDEFNVVENNGEFYTNPNWRFSYAKDNTHIEDHDGIVIASIGSFEIGQKILKRLVSTAPRLEKLIRCGIGIQTSGTISTPLLRAEYVRMSTEMGDGHPYIKIYLNTEENFTGVKYV